MLTDRVRRSSAVLAATVSLLAPAVAQAQSHDLTRAEAERAAAAVDLTGTDLPGYRVEEPAGGGGEAIPDDIARCVGRAWVPEPLAGRRLAVLTDDARRRGIAAQVSVVRNALVAHNDVAALKRPVLARCLRRMMRAFLDKDLGRAAAKLHVTGRPLWVPGADTAGVRLSISFAFGRSSMAYVADARWLVQGPIEVSMVSDAEAYGRTEDGTVSKALRRLPSADEVRTVMDLLRGRAAAALPVQ